ncbi:MAG: hypothetical protein COY40_04135 [Alphaproteobacteria bacterium CG_4_10_14_0_8_um_filter_53_9]|nr:MAG: hypothetical protein COY40_04135 [Alphaproteobacteria bacterium CG_4_10_14_0_8_um_filter_53_9]
MILKSAPRLTTTSLATVLLLAACAAPKNTGFNVPSAGDEGVVIATTSMVPGVSETRTYTGTPADCDGPGLGIKVEGTTGTEQELYDASGEPCEAAEVMFDGRTPTGSRPADPTIQIGFNDKYGPLPESKMQRLPSEPRTGDTFTSGDKPLLVTVPSAPAMQAQPEHMPAPKPDPLLATLQRWEGVDNLAARESARAAARDLNNIVENRSANTEENAMLKLQARLREAERRVQEEERRRQEVAKLSSTKRAEAKAELDKWEQEQQDLKAQIMALELRATHFASENQRLAAEKEQQAKQYQAKIGTLSSDLRAAERQAEATRNKLILQAAAKIAEAEQLANAAKLQEQEIKLREAARLKTEAEDMMNRALAIKAGEGMFAPQDIKPSAAPMPLSQVPVVLHARDKTLEELVQEILKKAAAQGGEWSSDWQLSKQNNYILNEKWSLTAEAPVAALLQQLAEQVKQTHKINLTFTQFSTSRLLVITDD